MAVDARVSYEQWDVVGELRRFVVRYVAKAFDKPHVRDARMIDVSRAIGEARAAMAPGRRDDEGVIADLSEALDREIRDHEETFVGDVTTGDPGPCEVG